MKKIFSAFLLMTMMVFSVGSFVSCSDLENELAQVEGTANDNAAAIESLNSELAALKTALSAAQADADAAMAAAKAAKEAGDAAKAEAEAAKAAAEQAKAEAIAAVMAEVEAIQTAIAQNVEAITNLSGSVNANAVEIEALQEEVKALQTAAAEHVYAITNLNGSIENHEMAIEDLETELSVLQSTLANYEKNLEDLGLLTEEFKEDIAQLTYAVTNLTTAVETNTNDIDGLKEQFEDVVAQVETLNASLIAIYDILGVLANQIQSVVFVPEFQNEGLTAERFTYSTTVKSNYLAIGTYEVRPAKLAASLTSENLSFASVDLKTTKAANAPEYFKAEIIGEPDPATGRVVVAAVINNNKDVEDNDYAKVAEGVVALSLNIASVDVTELLIAESAAANVEMVSSEYVTITSAKDIKVTELVGFPVVSQGVKGISSDYTNSVEMPWNTPLANSKVNLFETEVCVLVQDTFLSLEKASELLGLEFAVDYPENSYKLETNAGTDKDSPIKVTGKDLTATAELVVSEDYVDNAAVGQYAKVTLKPDVKVGKVVVNNHLNAVATYTVDNKKSDFTFADAETIAWEYSFNTAAPAFTQELAVVGFDKMDKTSKPWTFVAQVGDDEVEATVTALSSKAVEVSVPAGLPFKKGEEAVYEFKGTVTYEKVDYTVVFDVTLGAMPEDKVINLNTINAVANTTSGITVDGIDPVLQIREAIAAVDPKFAELTSYEFKTKSEAEVAEDDVIKVNGEEVESGVSFTLAAAEEDEVLVDNSTITIEKDLISDYDNTIEIVETYNVCGVDYTVKATVVTAKPEFTFKPATAYVSSDNKVKLEGTIAFNYADANKLKTGKAGDPFALNSINLRNYVDVVIPEDYADDYQIRYTLKTTLKDEDGEWLENPETEKPFGPKQLPAFLGGEKAGNYTIEAQKREVTGNNSKCEVYWRTDMREIVYEIALVSKTQIKNEDDENVDNVFASFEVTLVAPSLLTMTADETPLTVKCLNGKVQGYTNVVYGLNITDKYGNIAYNPYATSVADLWNGYEVTVDASGNVTSRKFFGDSFFHRYDQELVLPESVKAFIGTEDVTAQLHPSVDAEGNVTIQPESGEITDDVVVEVPVVLTYLYDEYGVQALSATVKVLFTKKADAVETPGAGDVTYDTPNGKQWLENSSYQMERLSGYEQGSNGRPDLTKPIYQTVTVNVNRCFDFGVSTFNYYGNSVKNVFAVTEYAENVPVGTELVDGYFTQMLYRYEVIPSNATSGVIRITHTVEPDYNIVTPNPEGVLMPDGNTYDVPLLDNEYVFEVPYTDFNGSTVTVQWDSDRVSELTLATSAVEVFALGM